MVLFTMISAIQTRFIAKSPDNRNLHHRYVQPNRRQKGAGYILDRLILMSEGSTSDYSGVSIASFKKERHRGAGC